MPDVPARLPTLRVHGPATRWEDAFLTGNGRHGALVLGGPRDETVVVTHHDLVLPNGTAGVRAPDIGHRLEAVRDLVLAGRGDEALRAFTDGRPLLAVQPFHPAFALRLRLPGPATVPLDHERVLDLATGVATARWTGVDGAWRTDCFVSRVDDVVVLRVLRPPGSAGEPGRWDDVRLALDPWLPGAPCGLRVHPEVRAAALATGVRAVQVTYPRAGAAPGYAGATRVAVHGDEAVLLTRVARSRGASLQDAEAGCRAALAALDPGYAGLLDRHAVRHRPTAERVTLDLDVDPGLRALPVPELLDRARRGDPAATPALLELLFAAGRHHLLSASGARPPRLVGLWQGDWDAAWSAAFTLDANLPLQLAGAVTAAVPEAVTGLARLVADQLPHWRDNARLLFAAPGAVAPCHTDGENGASLHFDDRWPLHLWTAGADWLLVTLLDHARSTGDREFLRRDVLPLLVATVQFYEHFLTRLDGAGRVVVVPSYSPENAPRGGSPAAVDATMDVAAAGHALGALADLVRDDPALAAEVGLGPADARRWDALRAAMPPFRVTPSGRGDGVLAEWGRPGLEDDQDHRHVSHLYPAWPLHRITVHRTPHLAAAALRALRRRGVEDGSAHGCVHRALVAARLRCPELVDVELERLLAGDSCFDGLMTSHYPGRRVFNADAACALPGVLVEALVDAEPGRVELLPAVPQALASGRLRGARTVAGVVVEDLRWDLRAGTARALLQATAPGRLTVACPGDAVDVDVGPPRRLRVRLDRPAGRPDAWSMMIDGR